MICKLKKEKCSHCLKNVNTGHPFFECFKCDSVIHGKCFKSSESEIINSLYYCFSCKSSIKHVYNPFRDLVDDADNDDESLTLMSELLDKCKQLTVNEMKQCSESDHDSKMLFQNIDGNKSNFDSFLVELDLIKCKFPIIGLAETNISPEESSVYSIPGYNSFYQDTMPNKSKGTGVALYIEQNLNAVVNYEASVTTVNLETLFLTIAGKRGTVSVGVLYRPPSGDTNLAMEELTVILNKLPRMPVHMMGDFNINLHSTNSRDVKYLETATFSLGFAPLISTATHEKPGCKPSCIDNIFTNEPENTIKSGTIDLGITHHHAVFQCFNGIDKSKFSDMKHIQYYDYCKSNVEKLYESLEHRLHIEKPKIFNDFFTIYNYEIERACKLSKPKCSKRNIKANPWISASIIASVNRKHELYNLWKKSKKVKCKNKPKKLENRKTCTCSCCLITEITYNKYKAYRKVLKCVIRQAKLDLYGSKLEKCSGDSKKTWKVINELRGKSRRCIKPSFIVDSVKITNRRVIAFNEFNKYFTSLAGNLNKSYTDEFGFLKSGYNKYLPPSCESSIYMNDCTEDEVSKIITDLQNGKASDIPVHIVKSTGELIVPHLTKYFNLSLSFGLFPDVLKRVE